MDGLSIGQAEFIELVYIYANAKACNLLLTINIVRLQNFVTVILYKTLLTTKSLLEKIVSRNA